MKHYIKNLWIQLTLGFIFLLSLDQLTKFFSDKIPEVSFLGFSTEKILNPGIIFGLNLENTFISNSILNIFTVSTLIMAYIILLYFLPKSFIRIRWGLTFIFTGAFSNLLDRLIYHQVIDILKFQFINYIYYINFADIIQTAGWLIVFYEVLKKRRSIWRKFEQRKSFIVFKRYQNEFIIYTLWMSICTFLLVLLFSLNYLHKISSLSLNEHNALISAFPFDLFYLFLLFLIPVLLITIYFSNKVYGPVYAFEKYVKSLLKEKPSYDLKLRDNDHFKSLEELSKEIKNKLYKD